MAVCSYVERRRQTYYFRARLPGALAAILGRTHVIGSLLTTDARAAKIRAAKFYFILARHLHILDLRMRDDLRAAGLLAARDATLAKAAFELGRRFEADQARLRQHYEAELRDLIATLQQQWRHEDASPASGETEIMAILRPPAPLNPPASAIPGLPAEGGGPILEPAPAPSPAWHALCEAFFADRPGLTPKTIWSYNQAFAIWKALIGDRPIAAVRRGDVKLFADHLRDKPNPRGGALHHKSILRSLGHIKSFLSWAVAAGHATDDRFGDVKGRDKTREELMAGDTRRAFTAAEQNLLFHSPLFRAWTGEEDTEAAAWFLLIAALTGARTEEITEAPATLVSVGNKLCLDLRQAGTKTRAAPRLVPLPPDLIRLGLPAWARRQAERGRRLVQPGAEPRTAAAWSKYLNRYIRKHVAEAPDLVLYSLRHSFRQMLRAANIGDELANKVFGHESGTVGAGYGRTLSPQEAELVAARVRPLVDLGHLAPWHDGAGSGHGVRRLASAAA